MARTGDEEEKIKLLTLEFTSEESDPDDSGAMALHQPQWCSKVTISADTVLALFYTIFCRIDRFSAAS